MKRFALLISALLILDTGTSLAGTASLPNAKVLLLAAGTPSNGTNEIQTITFGSGQSSGVFFLRFNNQTSSSITWSSTNATLVANIDAALEAMNRIGSGGVTTAEGSLTAGIGTVTVTFTGTNAKKNVVEMTVPSKTTSGTIAVTTTTPGSDADGRLSAIGTLLVDADSGALFINTGAPPNVSWTSIAP